MGRIREAGIDKLGVVALREDTPAVPEKEGQEVSPGFPPVAHNG